MSSRGEAINTTAPALPLNLRGALENNGVVLAAMFVAIGIYYLIPGTISAIVGGALFFALAAYRPQLTIPCIAATVSLFYRSRQIGPYLFPLAEVLLVLSLAGWAVHDGLRLVRGQLALPQAKAGLVLRLWAWATDILRKPFVWSALAFMLAGAMALVLPHPTHRAEALREFRWTIVEPVLFFALFLRFVKTRDDVFLALNGLLVGAAVNGQVGFSQYLFGDTWSMEGVGRSIGLYPGATAFGIFTGRTLAISATLALFMPTKEERWRRWRIAYFLLALPIALGMIFSFSRGAWIGVLVALALVSLIAGARRIVLMLIGGAVIAVPVFLVLGVERLVSLFTLSEGTNASRLIIWRSALRVIRDHPIWGIGQDQFLYQPDSYGIPHTRFQPVSHPHDFILDTWLRLGFFGLLAMVATILSYLFVGVRAFFRWKGTVMGALILALVAGMIEHATHGLFDMAYFTQDLALTFWLMLGCMAALIRIKPDPAPADAATTALT